MENFGGFVLLLLYKLIIKLTGGWPPAIHRITVKSPTVELANTNSPTYKIE